MLPILYPSNTSTSGFFQNNGLGFFNRCTKCEITEERNGIYELAMTILPSDRLAKTVLCGMFVKIKSNPHDDPQVFEIYAISVEESKITISGQHIHYLMNTNISTEPPVDGAADTPENLWSRMQIYFALTNPFSFSSDITSSHKILSSNNVNISLGEMLCGVVGSMVDIFGGELYYDNFHVSLLSRRGTDTGIALRYGSNISSKKQDSGTQTVYTHIAPYAYITLKNLRNNKESQYYLFYTGSNHENTIVIPNSILTYEKVLSYDFSDRMQDVVLRETSEGNFENWQDVQDRLQEEAENYISKYSAQLTQISANVEIDLAETLQGLQQCKLGDTVLIDFGDNGTTARAKIIKTVYDSLEEKYIKMELGQPKKTIADMITVKNLGGA